MQAVGTMYLNHFTRLEVSLSGDFRCTQYLFLLYYLMLVCKRVCDSEVLAHTQMYVTTPSLPPKHTCYHSPLLFLSLQSILYSQDFQGFFALVFCPFILFLYILSMNEITQDLSLSQVVVYGKIFFPFFKIAERYSIVYISHIFLLYNLSLGTELLPNLAIINSAACTQECMYPFQISVFAFFGP